MKTGYKKGKVRPFIPRLVGMGDFERKTQGMVLTDNKQCRFGAGQNVCQSKLLQQSRGKEIWELIVLTHYSV